jgi:hypothetical protein
VDIGIEPAKCMDDTQSGWDGTFIHSKVYMHGWKLSEAYSHTSCFLKYKPALSFLAFLRSTELEL